MLLMPSFPFSSSSSHSFSSSFSSSPSLPSSPFWAILRLLLVLIICLICPVANCLPSMRTSSDESTKHLHPPVPVSAAAAAAPAAASTQQKNFAATKNITNSSEQQQQLLPFAGEHPLLLQHSPQIRHDPLPPTREETREENKLVVEVDASPGFLRAAELLRNSIDERVDPCEDFFEFSCGKWIVNNPIPDDLTSFGHFSELREKVNHEMRALFESPEKSTSRAINNLKKLYRGCMDVQDLNARNSSELLNRIEQFGHWPIVAPSKWREEEFDLTGLLVEVGKSRAIDVFIDVYVSLDQKNVTRRLLNFDQGGLGLGASARDYYLNDTRYGSQMAAYRRYMIEKISTFAKDSGVLRREVDVAREVDEIIDFEREFARILVPDEDRRNYTKMYNLRRLSDMDKIFGTMDWARYFEWLIPAEMQTYVDSNPEVILAEPEFFERLNTLLSGTPKRVMANYILWRFASAWSFQLDERYDDIQQHFLRHFLGKKAKSPRWKDCASAASTRMSYASGAMYVRAHFDRSSKEAALAMIEDLRASFRAMLAVNDWMDPGTKEYALIKAEQMLNLIGFPDFLYNDTQLDAYYENFSLSPNDHYALQVEKASIWSQRKAFHRLIEPVERDEFGTSSAVVNAFYSGVKNAITFPAAILQAPFFDQSFPKVVNYGGIGAVIGHEITHGFDDQGAQFDGRGNLKDWWDPSTQQRFIERKKCIIDQYSAFEVPQTGGLRVNGVLTQGENIADNGGIKQALAAYRTYLKKIGGAESRLPGLERYNNEQLFFISYAQTWCGHTKPETLIRQILTDPHSPYHFRVNGVVANQPEFASAFNCPTGAPMHLPSERRCSVW